MGDATVPHALAAFRMGAVIFIGTWCLHTHFDYRLVFLLLTVPQIVRWCGAEHGAIRAGARIALAALSLVLWSLAWRHGLERAIGSAVPGLMLDAALGWLLAATLLVGTVLSLPDWAVPRACRGAPLVDLPVVPAGAILSLPLDGGHRRPDRGFGAGSA